MIPFVVFVHNGWLKYGGGAVRGAAALLTLHVEEVATTCFTGHPHWQNECQMEDGRGENNIEQQRCGFQEDTLVLDEQVEEEH